jgi:hypothetical protein
MANIAEPIRKRKKWRGGKAVGKAFGIEEFILQDAVIVTNKWRRKQESRLASAFLLLVKQAKPVRGAC